MRVCASKGASIATRGAIKSDIALMTPGEVVRTALLMNVKSQRCGSENSVVGKVLHLELTQWGVDRVAIGVGGNI